MQPNPQNVANLNEFVSITEHKERYFEERFEPLTSTIIIIFCTMEINGAPQLFGSNRSSKYLPLCSATERNSFRFATA